MSTPLPVSDEFLALLDAACDGSLPESQLDRFTSFLDSDPAIRKTFINHVRLRTNVRFLHRAERACDLGLARIEATPPPLVLDDSEPFPLISVPLPPCHVPQAATYGLFTSGWPLAYLVATVTLVIGLAIGALVHVSDRTDVVRKSVPRPPLIHDPPAIVGRITGMVDCRWEGSGFRVRGSGDGTTDSPLSPLPSPLIRLGDRIALKSGLLEITYDTGARVVLQGPVTYEVESPAGGYLSVGKLTAKLEKRSAVSGQQSETSNPQSLIPNPLFAIRTPTALVTDLGTEFGVEVDGSGNMTCAVQQGKVEVSTTRNGVLTGSTVRITRGEAVRVDSGDSSIASHPSAVMSTFVWHMTRLTHRTTSVVQASPTDCTLIPTVSQGAAWWRYTTRKPSDNWTKPDFNDSQWAIGKAGFGADVDKGLLVDGQFVSGPVVATPWTSSKIWLRKEIIVHGPLDYQTAALSILHDDAVEVYVNGKMIFSEPRHRTEYATFDVAASLKTALKEGANTVAVHVSQVIYGQYIDLGLVLSPKRPIPPVPPLPPNTPATWPIVLIPLAEDDPAVIWRSTSERPTSEWSRVDFDDSQWQERTGPFVTGVDMASAARRLPEKMWLRRKIDLPDVQHLQTLILHVRHDGDVEVFVNGNSVFHDAGSTAGTKRIDITQLVERKLRKGANVVAIHAEQWRHVDVGLIAQPAETDGWKP